MMTAFYYAKETKDINIVSNNKNIHGVMSPINWLLEDLTKVILF